MTEKERSRIREYDLDRRKGSIVAFAGMCPYLKDARSSERTVCECAKFTFPDRIVRRKILYGYCGHPTAWRSCPFKTAMDGYYERKYAVDEAEPAHSTVCRQGGDVVY